MTSAEKIAKAFSPKGNTEDQRLLAEHRKIRLLAALEALKRGVDRIIKDLK